MSDELGVQRSIANKMADARRTVFPVLLTTPTSAHTHTHTPLGRSIDSTCQNQKVATEIEADSSLYEVRLRVAFNRRGGGMWYQGIEEQRGVREY